MSALASAAFRLALRGVAVFPLATGAKAPMAGSHGCHDATTDYDVVRAHWAKTPQANIGAATGVRSGNWVLDIDPRHGGDQALADLEAEHGPLPNTITANSPSGGRHLYWRWNPDGEVIGNSASRVGPGLDVRGEGGYVVAPPSLLANGGAYSWVKNGQCALADAPSWLILMVLPPPPPPQVKHMRFNVDVDRYVASAAASELKELETAPQGTRNDALNRASYSIAQFVKAGALPEDWARVQLETRAINLGLSFGEVRGTISSAFKAAQPRRLPS